MKTALLKHAIKLPMIFGIGYALSLIITKEVVTVVTLLIVFSIARWVFRITVSLLVLIVKWICIIVGIGSLIATF